MSGQPVGVGVIGLGMMGATHVRAYHRARADGLPCRLVAVCSNKPEELTGIAAGASNLDAARGQDRLFDPAEVRGYERPEDMAADPRVGLVSVCTPTDTHVDVASMMLRAGKHVLVEKPAALRSADVRELERTAGASGRHCVPAMCMRFWPGWDWLKERVEDGSLGAVRAAAFTRVGSAPDWSPEFYRNPARSGGALIDLHIHDADAVLWLFGRPDEVVSTGSVYHVSTQYRYSKGPAPVTAEGGWVAEPGFPFRMRYTVAFERATADWDLSRADTLLLSHAGKTEVVALPSLTAYEREVQAMVELVTRGGRSRVTMADAVAVAELLEAEQSSLDTGRPVSTK